MLNRLYDFLVRIAGHSAAELDGQPWEVRKRRICFGLLVLTSAAFAATMLTLAVARIQPLNPSRWIYSTVAGLVYFVAIASFDSLFVANADPRSSRTVWGRIVLSLLLMAFTATTIDASIAGDRLLAEIDKRKAETTLAMKDLHRKVHGLDERQGALLAAATTLDGLDRDLAGDPQTPEFEEAVSAVVAALQEYRELKESAEPKLANLRARIAALRAQLAAVGEDQADERAALAGQFAAARSQRIDLERAVAGRKHALDTAAARADAVRREWRAQKNTLRQQASHERDDAAKALRTAQADVDRDSAASRAVNAQAFQANLIEEMAAYWSLASREHNYLFFGVVAWLCAAAFELLAVLMKLLTKGDSLDDQQRTARALAAIEGETQLQIARVEGVERQWQEERARAESEVFLTALRLKGRASEEAAQALLTAWHELQQRKDSALDERVRASLEAQFVSYQQGLDAQVTSFMSAAAATASLSHAMSPATAGATPEEVFAPARPHGTAKTVVL